MAIKRSFLCDVRSNAGKAVWDTCFGENCLEAQNRVFESLLARMHGEAVLWVGEHAPSALQLQGRMVRNPVYLPQQPIKPDLDMSSFAARLEELPFKSNAFDGIVLHHALEMVDDPRIALREVARVLAPGGRLIVAGFNPWSLVGLRRVYARVVPDFFRGRSLINPIRLFDWLTLLGLELDRTPRYVGHSLFFNHKSRSGYRQVREPARPRRRDLPFGGLFIVSAVKQAMPMNLQWQLPKENRRLAPVAYPRVASWRKAETP